MQAPTELRTTLEMFDRPPESALNLMHRLKLAFDPKNHPPLCNLYVTMLQRLGIEADRFGSSTGTLTGLEALG